MEELFPTWGEMKVETKEDPISTTKKKRERCAMYEFTPEYLYRRAYSEMRLLDLFKTFDFKQNSCYNFLTAGDIDQLSYLKAILRSQSLEHCLMSTWCMAAGDALQCITWMEEGTIKRLDLYVGEIFKGSYYSVWKQLHEYYETHRDKGRICVFRNHSKIIAGTGERFAFGLQSSANIDTNPRTENACLQISEGSYLFYKEYFDNIITFEKDDREEQSARHDARR